MRVIARLLAATALSVVGAAHASDGRIELNQAIVATGGATPEDAPGFPLTLSLPGSYELTGDLLVPDENTTAIRITAPDVTLDLRGHRIFGPNQCVSGASACNLIGSGVGVDASLPAEGLHVRNGTIWGMGGAGIVAGENARVGGVRVFHNGAIGITAASAARITRVLVEENGLGIWLASGRLTHSVVRGNLQYGVSVLSQASLLQNTVSGNGGPGITASFASIVIGNVARNNGGDGIRSAGVVRGNVSEGNGRCGIVATNHAMVSGNTTAHNGHAGLHFRPGVVGFRSNVVSEGVPLTSSGTPSNLGGNLCGSCVVASDATCDFESP